MRTALTVTITPTAKAGTFVPGRLHVDDVNLFTDAGDEPAAFPNSFMVDERTLDG